MPSRCGAIRPTFWPAAPAERRRHWPHAPLPTARFAADCARHDRPSELAKALRALSLARCFGRFLPIGRDPAAPYPSRGDGSAPADPRRALFCRRLHSFPFAASLLRRLFFNIPGVGTFSWKVGLAMRHILAVISLLFAMAVGVLAAHGQAGFDRPGGDYTSFPVRGGDPALCAARCEREGRCRAWSFRYPGPGRCFPDLLAQEPGAPAGGKYLLHFGCARRRRCRTAHRLRPSSPSIASEGIIVIWTSRLIPAEKPAMQRAKPMQNAAPGPM